MERFRACFADLEDPRDPCPVPLGVDKLAFPAASAMQIGASGRFRG